MAIAPVAADSAASIAAADAVVVFVMPGAVTGTGTAVGGWMTLATLATFFESGDAPVHISSASAQAFSVGLAGATNPAFNVDSSTALQVAGLNVIGAVTGGTVALVTTDSGAASGLTINAKGTGTIGIGTVSTGIVTITPAVTLAGATVTLSTAGAASAIAGTTVASASDVASGAITVKGHIGRGTGAVGGIIFQVPVTTGSGTTAQTLTTVLTLSATTTVAATFAGALTVGTTLLATGLITATAGVTSVAAVTLKSGTAVPATAGAVAAGAPVILYSGLITIEATSDAPTHTRPKGSICINTGGGSGITRMYVNTDSAGTWTAVTTVG